MHPWPDEEQGGLVVAGVVALVLMWGVGSRAFSFPFPVEVPFRARPSQPQICLPDLPACFPIPRQPQDEEPATDSFRPGPPLLYVLGYFNLMP